MMLISILRGIKYDYLEAPKGGDHDDWSIVQARINAGLDIFAGKNIKIKLSKPITLRCDQAFGARGSAPEIKYTGKDALYTNK